MRIGVAGLGRMGSAIAARLIEVGDLEVHVADAHAVGDGTRRHAVDERLDAGRHGRGSHGVRPLSWSVAN